MRVEELQFKELTEDERSALLAEVRGIVKKGKIDWDSPFLALWIKDFCREPSTSAEMERQKLLLVSTVYPIHALLSLVPEAK